MVDFCSLERDKQQLYVYGGKKLNDGPRLVFLPMIFFWGGGAKQVSLKIWGKTLFYYLLKIGCNCGEIKLFSFFGKTL